MDNVRTKEARYERFELNDGVLENLQRLYACKWDAN